MFLTISLFALFSMFENTHLYVNICIYVSRYPSLTMRSEPLVNKFHIDVTNIVLLTYLAMCSTIVIVFNIDLKCRYLSFNTRLNTLSVSNKANRTEHLQFFLLFCIYLLIFEYYFIVFLPFELSSVHLDTRKIRRKTVFYIRMCHCIIASTALHTCHRLNYLVYLDIVRLRHCPLETLAIWIF